MATVQTLLDDLGTVGFDVTAAVQIGWLDRRHKKMLGRARAYRKQLAVGTTVADTAFYALDVLELYQLTVGGVPYIKARQPDVYGYSQDTLLWTGNGGLIVADYSAGAVKGLTLIPTPTAGGDAIIAYAAVTPPTLDDAADTVLVEDDFLDALVEGACATGFSRDTERLDVARYYEERFDAACEEYRRRTNSRFRGPGPSTIRIVGVNA